MIWSWPSPYTFPLRLGSSRTVRPLTPKRAMWLPEPFSITCNTSKTGGQLHTSFWNEIEMWVINSNALPKRWTREKYWYRTKDKYPIKNTSNTREKKNQSFLITNEQGSTFAHRKSEICKLVDSSWLKGNPHPLPNPQTVFKKAQTWMIEQL